MGDARQVGRAGAIPAAAGFVQQFLDMAHGGRRRYRHGNEMHDVSDVVGHLPERALERHEGSDRDLALGGEVSADRKHDEMQQQHRNRHGALDHGRQECGGGDFPPRLIVAHGEPAQRLALEHEGLDDRLGRDVFLHHAEQRGLVELLLVIGLHGFGRQNAWPDQRDRKHQERNRSELPVQEQHQDDASDQFEERQRSGVGKALDRPLDRRHVDRKSRQDFAALGAREEGGGQILDVFKQPCPYVRNQRSRELGVPPLVPDRDDRGDDAGHRQHRENS